MGKPKKAKKMRKGVKQKKRVNRQKTATVTESALISGFIKELCNKKYQSANKYLQELVGVKVKAKIASCINDNLF